MVAASPTPEISAGEKMEVDVPMHHLPALDQQTLVSSADSSAEDCTRDMITWGVRRKVKYIDRQREMPQQRSYVKMEVKEVLEEEAKEENKVGKREPKKPVGSRGRKRKATSWVKEISPANSKDRWSKERYTAAEVKLMEIMHEKGAILGKPILRQNLRAEARKHIGDTGLLDHLLKHMANKVVSKRNHRFRRRHNADGAMEYWLEEADLMDLRKQAGVQDPFWVPPPGWKPEDGPLLDPGYGRELTRLKEEIAVLKRDLEQKKHKNDSDYKSPSAARVAKFGADPRGLLQEIYNKLLKKKSQVEEQLGEIENSLNVMQERMTRVQEEIRKLSGHSIEGVVEEHKTEQEKEKEKKTVNGAKKEVEKEEEGGKKRVVRSGFRICKPQGTFLWPSSSMSTPQVQLQVEDLLMVPTPSSASSATSPPTPLPLSHFSSSPVKPLPKNWAVTPSSLSVRIPDSEVRDTWRLLDVTPPSHDKLPGARSEQEAMDEEGARMELSLSQSGCSDLIHSTAEKVISSCSNGSPTPPPPPAVGGPWLVLATPSSSSYSYSFSYSTVG